eukprot:TRINITY_DN3582_c2_g1_i1.p3 TRINITY_DN3582_c2_g1~~TRINITY_DN3582_c2_g1_i1.p3  ORF type:complete len:104 (-),score=1.68 TRINITY_DN3582_c2_g1_i1:138-449(-)
MTGGPASSPWGSSLVVISFVNLRQLSANSTKNAPKCTDDAPRSEDPPLVLRFLLYVSAPSPLLLQKKHIAQQQQGGSVCVCVASGGFSWVGTTRVCPKREKKL